MESPNTPNELGRTPIDRAASKGCTEIVKILVPLLDNPNAPDNTGWTPIHGAATYGHTDTRNVVYKKRSKNMYSLDFSFLYSCFLFSMTIFA